MEYVDKRVTALLTFLFLFSMCQETISNDTRCQNVEEIHLAS